MTHLLTWPDGHDALDARHRLLFSSVFVLSLSLSLSAHIHTQKGSAPSVSLQGVRDRTFRKLRTVRTIHATSSSSSSSSSWSRLIRSYSGLREYKFLSFILYNFYSIWAGQTTVKGSHVRQHSRDGCAHLCSFSYGSPLLAHYGSLQWMVVGGLLMEGGRGRDFYYRGNSCFTKRQPAKTATRFAEVAR